MHPVVPARRALVEFAGRTAQEHRNRRLLSSDAGCGGTGFLRGTVNAPIYLLAAGPSCDCTIFACWRWPSNVGTAFSSSFLSSGFCAPGAKVFFTASITA